MAYPTPKYSKNQINNAGKTLVSESSSTEEIQAALEVLGNWRGCHGYPINTFKVTLRQKLEKIDGDALVAQRLKRTPSILGKLRRFENMQLARMQDIGGLRAVVSTLKKVRDLEQDYRISRFEHELVSSKDYIANPKTDGYRSVHLVFKYKNRRNPIYDGFLLEMQFRTKLQHAWATAVETMGTYLGQSLKSRQGEEEWLKFFEVTGSAFAHIEKSPLIPGYEKFTREETFAKVAEMATSLQVLEKLSGFTLATNEIHEKSGSYYLVVLDPKSMKTTVNAYPQRKLEQATHDYTEIESKAGGADLEVVLVSAGSVENLRRAYPNYFLDTHSFIREVEKIVLASVKRSKATGKQSR